ncbi:hypothetical protein BJX64DRAFT_202526 [Aspergillus heterothallicus]
MMNDGLCKYHEHLMPGEFISQHSRRKIHCVKIQNRVENGEDAEGPVMTSLISITKAFAFLIISIHLLSNVFLILKPGVGSRVA